MCYPSKTLQANECAVAWLQYFGIFGVPAFIHTDGGSVYKRTNFEFYSIIWFKTYLVWPILMKRILLLNRRIGYIRSSIVFDMKSIDYWSECIPFAQRVCNAEFVESLGFLRCIYYLVLQSILTEVF